ncbi:hypothetical protein ACRTDR_16800 [Shewanella algae]
MAWTRYTAFRSPLLPALNSPHQLSPFLWREFPYLSDQPFYPAFQLSWLHNLAYLSSQPQQGRYGDPKFSSYLLYVQMCIGAGGNANVTVA